MRKPVFTPLLVCIASACSVYDPPAADNGGAAGAGAGEAGTMMSPVAAGMGGSGEPGGSTVVGTGGVIDDGGAMEAQTVEEVDGASAEGGMEAAPAPCAGFALQFSGFAYVRINRPVQDDFTLEAWIKTSTPSLTGTRHWEGSGLLWADVSGNHDDFGMSILNNKLAFGVGNPGGTEPTIVGTSLVVSGQWTHVAVTRSKATGTIQILVNGVQESTLAVANQLRSLTSQINMTLGGDVIDNRYFTGFMDEVRAWNVVRTAAEITATMHQKLVGNEPGLVGYWRFDEGSGTTTADGTATKNNGDIFAAPNWVASDAPVCP
jgi:Concanavalin A-like lectin/glucanases superfamily